MRKTSRNKGTILFFCASGCSYFSTTGDKFSDYFFQIFRKLTLTSKTLRDWLEHAWSWVWVWFWDAWFWEDAARGENVCSWFKESSLILSASSERWSMPLNSLDCLELSDSSDEDKDDSKKPSCWIDFLTAMGTTWVGGFSFNLFFEIFSLFILKIWC